MFSLKEFEKNPSQREMSLTELENLLGKRTQEPSVAASLAKIRQVYPNSRFNAGINYWNDGSISSVFVQTEFDSISLDGHTYEIKNGEVISPVDQSTLDHLGA